MKPERIGHASLTCKCYDIVLSNSSLYWFSPKSRIMQHIMHTGAVTLFPNTVISHHVKRKKKSLFAEIFRHTTKV